MSKATTIAAVLEIAACIPDEGFTIDDHCSYAVRCLARIRWMVENGYPVK